MGKNEITRLSDVIEVLAPDGSNDARWFLVEHQLAQAKMSLQISMETLKSITQYPENHREGIVAAACVGFVKGAYCDLLREYSAFLHYISDSDIPGRVAGQQK